MSADAPAQATCTSGRARCHAGRPHDPPPRTRYTGPTVDLAVTFQTHGYHERVTFSSTEESGMGNSWSKLAVPYLLPRYVFPLMKHAGWIDLRTHELDALCLEGVGASEHCSWATELSLASLPLAVSRKVM